MNNQEKKFKCLQMYRYVKCNDSNPSFIFISNIT